MTSALALQVGGNHYKRFKIQPGVFCHLNGLTLFEGNVIKYVTRHEFKHGLEDLKKSRHCIQLIAALHNEEGYAMLPENHQWTITPEVFCNENKLDEHQAFVVYSVCYYRMLGIKTLTNAISAIDKLVEMHYNRENE